MRRHVIPDGTNYADAIRELVLLRSPNARFKMAPTDRTTRWHVTYEDLDDPWGEAETLARQLGMRLERRGDRVTVRVPLKWKISRAWDRYLVKPGWRLRWWIDDRRIR